MLATSDTPVETRCSATSDIIHCRKKQQGIVLQNMEEANTLRESALKATVAALTDASASDPLMLDFVIGYFQQNGIRCNGVTEADDASSHAATLPSVR